MGCCNEKEARLKRIQKQHSLKKVQPESINQTTFINRKEPVNDELKLNAMTVEGDKNQSLITLQTQANIEAHIHQFQVQKQALDDHFKIKTQQADGKIFIKTHAELNMQAINDKLRQFAKKNGYKTIQLVKQKTLRGGDYHKVELNIVDNKITIKQMIEEMFVQKDKVGSYYYDVSAANKELKLLTQSQLNQFKQFKDKADELCVGAVTLSNMKKGKTSVDVAFVIDSTGSMIGLFEHAKQTCDKIAKQARFQDRQIDFKFALITYRDHNPNGSLIGDAPIENLYDFRSFTDIYQKVSQNTCNGGDDTPQAVHDALLAAGTRLSWRPQSYKYVWLIADSPPHGTQYHGNSCGDSYPSGCPCGITLNQIVKLYEQKKISFQFCPVVGGQVFNTHEVFQKHFVNCNYHLNNTTFIKFFDDFSAKITQRFETFKKLLPKILTLKQQLQKKRHFKAYEQAVRLLEQSSEFEKALKSQQIYERYSKQLSEIKKNVTAWKNQFNNSMKQIQVGMKSGYDHNKLNRKATKLKQYDILLKNIMEAFTQIQAQ